MSGELIREHEGHVTRLTLNRPDKANALSASLVEALLDAVEYASTDGTRLLILAGNGPHFCAGFDFTGYEDASDGDLALRLIRIETLLQALYHAPFATVACAHGRNFGAGADLVISCGTRIATPDATFRMPGLRFGIVLGTRRLMQRVGTDQARTLLAASATINAEAARAIGFVNRIASRENWPQLLQAERAHGELLTPAAAAALYSRTLIDTRAEDMAALAASVSKPGLRERIRLFRTTEKQRSS